MVHLKKSAHCEITREREHSLHRSLCACDIKQGRNKAKPRPLTFRTGCDTTDATQQWPGAANVPCSS